MPIGGAGANTEFEELESASQADTEPLAFDEEANDDDGDSDELIKIVGEDMDQDEGRLAENAIVEGEARLSDGNDIEMKDADEDRLEPSREAGEDEDADDDGDADAVGSQEEIIDNDELSASQATGASPSKNGQGGTNFSDESDLTDEPDDDEEDEEEGDEEDNIGDDAEDDEELDEDDEADEDEAAEGLAALTGGQASGNDVQESGSSTPGGALDELAVIAAAAEAEAEDESSQAEDDTDNDSIAGSHTRKKGRRNHSAIPRRTTTRLNEMMVASPAMSEDDIDEEDEEEEEAAELNRASSRKTNREMSSLIGLSSAAKRHTKPGVAGGLLAGAPSITIEGANSAVPSTATSRAGSVKLDDEDEEEEGQMINTDALEGDAEDKNEEEDAEGEEVGTPAQELDEVGPEEEPSTDEAALRRQEAMEALTKIEIGFAHLRDKLYIERMNEVSKEGEMILEGTHPDLIHLSNLIEIRREKKLKLVEKWFEEQEKQYERVAMTEEAAAWNNWRNEVVELRRQELFNTMRKRRRLDREKRTLDVPRPIKRHQIFETELIRDPDYDRKLQRFQQENSSKTKAKARQERDEMAAYVAFPDLRSADEAEAWTDMERMGIAGSDPRMMHGMGPPGSFYRPEEDPYAMYAIEQQQQIQQQSGPGAGPGPSATGPPSAFGPYGPPLVSEYPPYEPSYDGRPGHQGQPLQGYAVDAYGRPLSPTSASLQQAQHPSTGSQQGVSSAASHRAGHRAPEPYHPNDHSSSHPKGARRSPPPTATISQGDRETKPPNNARGGGGGGTYSPPPSSLSRTGDYTGNTGRAPPSQYPKFDDGPYSTIGIHANVARPPSKGIAGGVNSASIRPKSENAPGMEMGSTYQNHRHQEHLYSR